jgi:ribosomal subunit interface protein
MKINVQATGVDLTEALKRHATEKIESLEKFFDGIVMVNVDMGMKSQHHQKGKIFFAEANVHLPGKMVRVVKEANDLYKAVDKVKDHLKVELKKAKEKMRDKDKKMLRESKAYQD